MACTVLAPTSKANVGDPPSVLTVITSLKVAVAFKVSPAFKELLRSPVEPLKATLLTVGARVSMLMLGVMPAVPRLPAKSV